MYVECSGGRPTRSSIAAQPGGEPVHRGAMDRPGFVGVHIGAGQHSEGRGGGG